MTFEAISTMQTRRAEHDARVCTTALIVGDYSTST
jgi:hypothetical protein